MYFCLYSDSNKILKFSTKSLCYMHNKLEYDNLIIKLSLFSATLGVSMCFLASTQQIFKQNQSNFTILLLVLF
jgi:hypothetical protein